MTHDQLSYVYVMFHVDQVNFNEPLSMVQRLVEDLEYADMLHTAAECKTTLEEMCYVAGFTIGAYASTAVRNTKPFNPLLGETYEFDRSEDLGWKALCEQVLMCSTHLLLYSYTCMSKTDDLIQHMIMWGRGWGCINGQ